MSWRAQPLRRLLVLAIQLVPLCAPVAAAPADGEGADDSIERYLSIYTEVLRLVDRAYVEEADLRSLIASSFEGASDALDPFSVYVPPSEVDAYRAARSSGRGRSGLQILKSRGVAYVTAIEEGSPASRADLEIGDIVSTLQGMPTRAMPLWKMRQMLAAPAGTSLDLELLRLGEKRITRFELAEFEPPAVRLIGGHEVPVLRIPRFVNETPAEVDRSLGGVDGGRLVLDLRGAAGGSATAAYAVAERFASGELGALVGRDGPTRRFTSPTPPAWTGELVLVVDRSTQGAAEILATVLRQTRSARLVGERTFGYAGETESIELSSGALLELTAAFYTGPDLQPLTDSLAPDLEVESRTPSRGDGTRDRPPRDEALERAVELLPRP